jgi:hypothetical protein
MNRPDGQTPAKNFSEMANQLKDTVEKVASNTGMAHNPTQFV